ncbi:MAG: hypothetical protein WA989_16680 [Henriciella sp.]|uniref:hypothetical protein n=1 Tax=Henriciella sp. TaxID=1968823 RepID=UPI003C74659D
MAQSLPSLINESARFTAVHAALVSDDQTSVTWLVSGAILMVQQACVLALSEAGADMPAMPGPNELVVRVADPAILPQPYTAPMKPDDHRALERVVAARNDVMHPRPGGLHLEADMLPDGVLTAVKLVRHLLLTQPVRPSMVEASDAAAVSHSLELIESSVDFWKTVLKAR